VLATEKYICHVCFATCF